MLVTSMHPRGAAVDTLLRTTLHLCDVGLHPLVSQSGHNIVHDGIQESLGVTSNDVEGQARHWE